MAIVVLINILLYHLFISSTLTCQYMYFITVLQCIVYVVFNIVLCARDVLMFYRHLQTFVLLVPANSGLFVLKTL